MPSEPDDNKDNDDEQDVKDDNDQKEQYKMQFKLNVDLKFFELSSVFFALDIAKPKMKKSRIIDRLSKDDVDISACQCMYPFFVNAQSNGTKQDDGYVKGSGKEQHDEIMQLGNDLMDFTVRQSFEIAIYAVNASKAGK